MPDLALLIVALVLPLRLAVFLWDLLRGASQL